MDLIGASTRNSRLFESSLKTPQALSVIADILHFRRTATRAAVRVRTLNDINLGGVCDENIFTATACEDTLSLPSYMDSLVFRHHTRSFHRASWRVSLRLQLPRLLRHEFGPF